MFYKEDRNAGKNQINSATAGASVFNFLPSCFPYK